MPPAVTGFFRANNTGETEDVAFLFTVDAVVHDEDREHRRAAIKTWIDSAISQYKPQAEVIDTAVCGDEWIVTAQVSGTFPGSPAQLRFCFGLREDRIASLKIGG